MSEKKEITAFVLSEFSELVTRWGFQLPEINDEEWITRIDYLRGNLGFEIELDWRDFDVFALLVRLENGKLPGGYYVSNRGKCRKHLNNVIREQHWAKVERPPPARKGRAVADVKYAATRVKCILLEHMERIINAGDTLFL